MVILGIDTAIRRTGYGVVRMEGNSISVLDCGVIRNAPSLKHSECLRRIYLGIGELIEMFRPDAASIEMAFVGKNVRTTMILSMARGAAIASAANAGVPVYEYSPKTAKRTSSTNTFVPAQRTTSCGSTAKYEPTGINLRHYHRGKTYV